MANSSMAGYLVGSGFAFRSGA